MRDHYRIKITKGVLVCGCVSLLLWIAIIAGGVAVWKVLVPAWTATDQRR